MQSIRMILRTASVGTLKEMICTKQIAWQGQVVNARTIKYAKVQKERDKMTKYFAQMSEDLAAIMKKLKSKKDKKKKSPQEGTLLRVLL